ncbi:MAG: hypothetical protein VX528_03520, partial [Candidatus Latescibacterota bacterium]|nr:hypothetical protein [Candidatus Latescibacterota bacterium]
GKADTEELWRSIRLITSRDNDIFLRADGVGYLHVPEIVAGLGIVESPDEVPIRVERADGSTHTVELSPVWNLDYAQLLSAREARGAKTPLHLSNRSDNYWYRLLPESKIVYVQYNRARDQVNETVADFSRRLDDTLRANPDYALVVDLRHNGGGDSTLNSVLISTIAGSRANQTGKLFVVVGRTTFSAAQNCACDFEQRTNAIFVGEPTGSSPNFVGESGPRRLPWSGFEYSISWAYHQHSSPFDTRKWIPPDICAEETFEDYACGRDPCLDAVMSLVRE